MLSVKKVILAVLVFSTGAVLAQQVPFSNQYLVNNHVLSPALSGATGNFETFVSYQKITLQMEGAPEYKSIFISGPVYGNMSLGGSFSKSTVTIFDGFSAGLDYAYHLRVSENHFVHFGLSFAFWENRIFIDYNQFQSMQSDPFLPTARKSLSYGFGLAYTHKTFQLGITLPRLGESSLMGNNTGPRYSVNGLLRVHTSVSFDLGQSLSLQPAIVVEKSQVEPLWFNVSALMRIKEVSYLELHYRQGNIMGFGVGLNPAGKLLLAYSYDLSGTGIMKYSSGIHEISLGFMLGKGNDRSYVKSAFRTLPKQPYYEWIK